MPGLQQQDLQVIEAFEPYKMRIEEDLNNRLDALGKPSQHDIFASSKNMQHQFIHWLQMHRSLLSEEAKKMLDEMTPEPGLLFPRHDILEALTDEPQS